MNNLNITQNSNDLNESENTQEKLYSNEVSMDDLLTYSEDISQNVNKNSEIDMLKNKKIPIIQSFNSEVTMSFLNNQNDINYSSKEIHSKTDFKNNDFNIGERKNIIKNCSDCKLLSLSKSDIFNYRDNDKDISGINESMNNLLSEFDIKDISLSKRRSDNFMEKNNYKIIGEKNNDDWITIKSENLLYKKNKENFISNNQISTPLNDNKNQIMEDNSNANSMCNYENLSNLNDISSNKNLIKKDEKDNKENKGNSLFLKNKINDLNINLNISFDNYKDNKFLENKYPYEIIDEDELDKKDNFNTSFKKENSFFFANKISKILKNCLKYTKAQCVNPQLQNNINPNEENKNNKDKKHFLLLENPIITKDNTIDKNCQKLVNQKVGILSPHKLTFEIQKNDCIEITMNNNQNDLSKLNINQSHLSISRAYNFSSSNYYFYNNEFLKKNNTTSFIIFPNQYSNNSIQNNKIKDNFNHQKKNLIHKYIKGNKKIYINNKNINVGKGDSNNFFYNPKNIMVNKAPSLSNNKINFLNNDKIKIEDELHTPDSNKNKVAPMTCIHKGSFVYYQDNSQSNNSIKYNYINNCSKIFKNNNSSFLKNNNYQKSNKIINQKNSNLKYTKINKRKNINPKKQNGIKNKNSTFIKVKNNNDCFKTIIKREKNMENKLKTDEKKFINTKEFYPIHNNINKTIKKDLKKNKNTNIRNSLNSNNNSINSNNSCNNRKNIINKIKAINKNNKLIEKMNNDLIKESSLFSFLYNNSKKNKSKNISRKSSNDKMKDKKNLTIIQNKNNNKMKIKVKKEDNINLQNNKKNISDKKYQNKEEKKLVRHNTNRLSEYNFFFEKVLDASNKKIKLQNKKNLELKKKNSFNKINNKSNKKKTFHKKINSQINLNALTSNFNFINQKRRKNNKSLYNFGNIFFINQNKIIENNYESINSNNNNNSNIFNFISKSNNDKQQKKKIYEVKKIKFENNNNNLKENININKDEINQLNISNIKKTPEIITDFSKYKKKKEYRSHFMSMVDRIHPVLNEVEVLNKLDNNYTQLISEH